MTTVEREQKRGYVIEKRQRAGSGYQYWVCIINDKVRWKGVSRAEAVWFGAKSRAEG